MIEDFLSVVEAKRFLGREFLTWLVYRAEESGGTFELGGQPVEIHLGDQIVLAGGHDGKARLTVVGTGDVRAEMGAGLRSGKLVDRARLHVRRGERRWELTLDGGLLDYASVRCPTLGDQDAGLRDDPRAAFENDLFLRMADVEDVVEVLDALFAEFCRLRATEDWRQHALPELRGWVEGLA